MRYLCSMGVLLVLLPLLTGAEKTDPSLLPKGAEKAATISALLPYAAVRRNLLPKSRPFRAKNGMSLTWNDVVKTDQYGRARIRRNDDSLLSVGVHTELRISAHDPQSHRTTIELSYGLLRA